MSVGGNKTVENRNQVAVIASKLHVNFNTKSIDSVAHIKCAQQSIKCLTLSQLLFGVA